jgi:antitoxin component HigA of HigAB toxin-antitoxin module
MAKMQDFWAMLDGGPVQPAEPPSTALYEARAEARSFVAALRLEKMTLAEVREAVSTNKSQAARLAAFAKAHPEELPIVETAIEFRGLVAAQLEKILRGDAK